MPELAILPLDHNNADAAADLLRQFFEEEGFIRDRSTNSANLAALRHAPTIGPQ